MRFVLPDVPDSCQSLCSASGWPHMSGSGSQTYEVDVRVKMGFELRMCPEVVMGNNSCKQQTSEIVIGVVLVTYMGLEGDIYGL